MIEIANGGCGEVVWHLEGGCSWLKPSKSSGRTADQETVVLTFDPEHGDVSGSDGRPCELFVCTEREKVRILVFAGARNIPELPPGTFLEGPDGFVMDAAHWTRKEDGLWKGKTAGYRCLEDYGRYGSGMKVFPQPLSFRFRKRMYRTGRRRGKKKPRFWNISYLQKRREIIYWRYRARPEILWMRKKG